MSVSKRRDSTYTRVQRIRRDQDYLPAPLDLRLAPAALSLWGLFLIFPDLEMRTWFMVSGGCFAIASLCYLLRLRFCDNLSQKHRLFPRGSAAALVALVAVTVGVACGVQGVRLETLHRDVVSVIAASEADARFNVLAQVVSTPRKTKFGGALVDLRVHQVQWRGETSASRALIQVHDEDWEDIPLGAWVRFRMRLRERDPTGEYLGFAKSPGSVQVQAAPTGRYRFVNTARSRLQEATASLKQRSSAMVMAMTLGYTGEQEAADKDAMQAAGLAHLTAVSGMHLSVLVSVALGITSRCRRRTQTITAALVMGLFLAMLEGSAAVTRAAVMGVMTLFGMALARPARGLSSLFVAVITMLILGPWQASSWGFALSVVATAAIVTLGRWLAGWLSFYVPTLLCYPLAVSISAQLACAPLMLGLRGKLQVWALPANLLTGAVSSIVTVGGLLLLIWGATTAFLPGFSDAVTRAGAWATGKAADWVLGVAHWFASRRGAEIEWLEATPGLLGLALAATSLLWLLYRLSERFRAPGGTPAAPWLLRRIEGL